MSTIPEKYTIMATDHYKFITQNTTQVPSQNAVINRIKARLTIG